MAFSPDGRTIAVAGNGKGAHGEVQVWDVTSRRQTSVLTGQIGIVSGVAFSPDGRTLATSSVLGSVRLWDVASRHEIAVLGGHTGGVNGVAFTPDGTMLATGGADGTARFVERGNAPTYRFRWRPRGPCTGRRLQS